MSNLNFFLIFFSLTVLLCYKSVAQVRDFETTRLQSSSGAGVASILVNETAVLNPAPIVFIPISSFYYQKGTSNLDSKSEKRVKNYSDGSSQMYLISDSTSQLKGTFSYQGQDENRFSRKRFTSSIASNLGKKSAIGVLYRYTVDDDKVLDEENKFHQAVFGFTHIHSERLSLGGIIVDPFLANKKDAKVVLGFQYNLTENFLLILDGGANFNEKPHKNTLYKGAFQVNFFKDLYLRIGQYRDKTTKLKGSSWGISWIGPRLSLEYAYKTSEVLEDFADQYLYKGEQFIESSLSLALVF